MAVLSSEQLNECFESAGSFLTVAEGLSKDLVGIVAGKMYPCVVNGAFACELFLKAIIGASDPNGVPKSHKLKDLFLKLDQVTQKSIKAEYEASSYFPLCSLLDEADNAFVEWRYAYEQEVQSHYIALIELGRVLEKYAQQSVNHEDEDV